MTILSTTRITIRTWEFVTCAKVFLEEKHNERALEMLNKMAQVMTVYPLDAIPIGFQNNNYMVVEAINLYFELGEHDKAIALADKLSAELVHGANFYLKFGSLAQSECEDYAQYIFLLADRLNQHGEKEMSSSLENKLKELIDIHS